MQANWTSRLYALLPRSGARSVLGALTHLGLALPSAIMQGRVNTAQTEQVKPVLAAACPLPFNILKCLACVEDPGASRTDALFLLEAREGAESNPGSPLPWLPIEGIDLPESLKPGFEAWLRQREHPSTPPGADWYMPGWHAQAEKWIEQQLAGIGLSVRAIEPVKSWSISVLLIAQAGDGRSFYFKSSRRLPLFVNEGTVMAALARFFPTNVPAPAAVDAERGWMLLPDFGPPLRGQATFDQLVQLFQAMARIQVQSITQVEALLRAGCIHRPIAWLQGQLGGLLEDEYSLSPLSSEERSRLARGLPRLRDLLDELDALPVPPTLVHGDLHAGNAALAGGHIQIFDWTDAAVSHPFFDVFDIFTHEDPSQREALEAAYRSAWNEAYPAEQVRRALEIARRVYGLYHAVSYSVIVNNLLAGERDELNGAHFFLRRVLAGLPEDPG